jgi:MEDS: MEthanogen/methylotroph, DcmR Sensory domain/Putative zinc-finger
MRQKLALVGCSTMSPEFYACARQLGLPLKHYGAPIPCLTEPPRGALADLVARARGRHDRLVVALGDCCGDAGDVTEAEGATCVHAANCRAFLLGPAAYQWCGANAVLPLSPHMFRMVPRRHPRELRELIARAVEAEGFRRIGAVDTGVRAPDPGLVAQMAQLSGCAPLVMHTGLGHLRETLRAAAKAEGLTVGDQRALIRPETLGAGDDILLVATNGDPCLDASGELLALALRRGMKAVWVEGQASGGPLAERLRHFVPDLEARVEAGQVEFVPPGGLIAEASHADDPARLVQSWKSQALQALNGGFSGLALIHGYGWADAAGLGLDYLLEYASRLSEACALWPILSATESPPGRYATVAIDELRRTHPLVWLGDRFMVAEDYEPSDEYLGAPAALDGLIDGSEALTCEDITPLISAMADGELPPGVAARISGHVAQCPTCAALLCANRDLKGSLQALCSGPVEPPPDLWDRFLEGIR